MSSSLPAFAPLMTQVLGPSAAVRVSMPPPPLIDPESCPLEVKVKLSAPAPPTRFSMPVNAVLSSLPPFAALMVQVLAWSAPTSVSLPPPPSTDPVTCAPGARVKVSLPAPPSRCWIPVKACVLSMPVSVPVTDQLLA